MFHNVYLNSAEAPLAIDAHSAEDACRSALDVLEVSPGDLLRVHSAAGAVLYAEREANGSFEFRTLREQRELEAANARSAYMHRYNAGHADAETLSRPARSDGAYLDGWRDARGEQEA